jgi:hypothetical protein
MTPDTPPRRDVRFPFSANALAVLPETGTQREGTVDNISRGGCFVRLADPFLLWAKVKLWVVYRHQQFEAEGSVTHSRLGYGMGIAFEKIPAASQEMLEHWIHELGG